MQELLKQLIENAKKDKKKVLALKEMAVKCQQFELAAEFRQIEKDFLTSWQQTEFIALQFKGANLSETCQNIHSWIRKYIKYQLDKKGQQDIKRYSPITIAPDTRTFSFNYGFDKPYKRRKFNYRY